MLVRSSEWVAVCAASDRSVDMSVGVVERSDRGVDDRSGLELAHGRGVRVLSANARVRLAGWERCSSVRGEHTVRDGRSRIEGRVDTGAEDDERALGGRDLAEPARNTDTGSTPCPTGGSLRLGTDACVCASVTKLVWRVTGAELLCARLTGVAGLAGL